MKHDHMLFASFPLGNNTLTLGLPKQGYACHQVSTHTHEFPHVLRKDVYHQDYRRIYPRGHVDGQGRPDDRVEFQTNEGAGVINCLWFTFMQKIPDIFLGYTKLPALEWLRLKIYFDDMTEPAVDCPFGAFFGVGFSLYKPYQSAYLAETSGGYVCYFPMPFKKNARVVVENTHPQHDIYALWGAVSYLLFDDPAATKDAYYFRTTYHREDPTTPGAPYTILDARDGPGHYVGVSLNMQRRQRLLTPLNWYSILDLLLPVNWLNFLEGNLKVWADKNPADYADDPDMEYTGTEDYFMGAFYYLKGEFSAAYHGLTEKSMWKRRISTYRFHAPPIPWKERVCVNITVGEFNEVPACYESVAYWYAP